MESGQYTYGGTLDALHSVLRAEGMRGLTAGLLPTLLRDVPFSGLYLMFYERLKRAVLSSGSSAPHAAVFVSGNSALHAAVVVSGSSAPQVVFISGGWVHFGCGLVAGVLASLVTQPADVVKTRLQLAQVNLLNI